MEEIIHIPTDNDITDGILFGDERGEPDISEVDAATIDQLSGDVDEVDEQTGAERNELQMGLYGM